MLFVMLRDCRVHIRYSPAQCCGRCFDGLKMVSPSVMKMFQRIGNGFAERRKVFQRIENGFAECREGVLTD